MTFNIDPVILEFGPFQVRYYGLMYVLAFLFGLLILRKLSRDKFLKLTYNEISDVLFWSFVGLLVRPAGPA